MTRDAWDAALEEYYAEHDSVLTDASARGPDHFALSDDRRQVRQTIADPEGHHDWVIEATVDIEASDELGELVLTTTAMRRL